MITPTAIYEFIKAFPKFVTFITNLYNDFIKMQISNANTANEKYIEELHVEIAKLKGAKTDAEIASAITAINNSR